MAKVKNMSGQTLEVPALGRVVLKGQEVEVTDEQVFGLTQQDIWEPVDKAAKSAHDAGGKDRDARLDAERKVWEPAPPESDGEPAAADNTEED